MENTKKASTRPSSMQQKRNNVHTAAGRGKKLKRAESNHGHASQIAALKANNTQLATALDDLKQDYRKLQQNNLQLKRERQSLLEKVARMEKRANKYSVTEPSMNLLQEAQCKLREAQSALDFVVKHSRSVPKQHSLELIQKQSSSPKKVLRFSSSSSQSEGCTIYPRTPHPLHNMTGVVEGPQLASTPVKMTKLGGSSASMHLSPQKINYSDNTTTTKLTTGEAPRNGIGEVDQSNVISPIEELTEWGQEENPAINHKNPNSTLDQLENALICDRMAVRPRRKCASLSLSYQEPSLSRKLRRGDPFTERGPTDWSPPDCKERQKKGAAKKSTTTGKRRVLQEVQNQL